MSTRPVLSDSQLQGFRDRAARLDRDNEFFTEDFEELRQAGYLRVNVPEEFGGLGRSLPEVALEQRRLAQHAPATALALTMHLYWTGAACDRYRAGDHSAKWVLAEAGAGEVFAAGHGEPGNDLAIDDSRTSAAPFDGGYRFTGRKVFTSLSPVWTRLGVHGRDDSDPDDPTLVHAFIDRDDPGVRTVHTWDTLGVRATRSDDTALDGAVATSDRVVGLQRVGAEPPPYIAAIFSWVLPLLGNVYYGIARRALDLAIDSATRRSSLALGNGLTQAHKPTVQATIADAEIKLDAAAAQLDRLAEEWQRGGDRSGAGNVRLFAAKEFATRTALEVVDSALSVVGASGLHRSTEIERLYRDVRSGVFHPPNSEAVRDVVGRTALGLL